MSPPTLTTIKRGLRHEILREAFSDAIEQDRQLNAHLRDLPLHNARQYPHEALNILKNSRWKWLLDNVTFDPHVSDLAANLIKVSSDLEEDVLFVLGKSLGRLEEEVKVDVQKKWEEMWNDTMVYLEDDYPEIVEWNANNGYELCPKWGDIRKKERGNAGYTIMWRCIWFKYKLFD